MEEGKVLLDRCSSTTASRYCLVYHREMTSIRKKYKRHSLPRIDRRHPPRRTGHRRSCWSRRPWCCEIEKGREMLLVKKKQKNGQAKGPEA